MRTSRLLLAGAGLAAAAVTGSAFTASNDMTQTTNVAGYGEATVTGTDVTDISYQPWSSDNTYLASVVFVVTNDISAHTATMTLKQGTTVVQGPSYACTFDAPTKKVTCPTGDHPAFTDFDTVGLTVVDKP